MSLFSPVFLLSAVRDELEERRGDYRKSAALHTAHYLDQRALALSADAYGGAPHVMWGRADLWQPDTYSRPDADVLWLRVDCLNEFVTNVLPRLERPVTLVTGESDWTALGYAPRATDAILDSDRIAHWFCSQCDIPADVRKVTPVPLGIPYPYRNDIFFAKPWYALSKHVTVRYDIRHQDGLLAKLVGRRKPLHARRLRAYGDFALNNTSRSRRFGESRDEVAAILMKSGCLDIPKAPVHPLRLYERYGDYAFVASPFGRGPDCYRTWEALLMGAVPIVRRSPIVRLFDGFPVAIVDDWREVTSQKLAEWAERFSGAWDDGSVDEKLSLAHWTRRIRAVAG